jgi:ElaB/YqjD/DUF883 family membrane-anchored ribosome-binding protein
MGKQSKKKKIKALENEVSTLRASLERLMEYIGYDGEEHVPVQLIQIEPYIEFQKKLRETEAKYASQAS